MSNDNENERLRPQVSECMFMKLPKCMLQDTTKRMDLEVCNACISGRTERHIFDIKELLAQTLRSKSNGRL